MSRYFNRVVLWVLLAVSIVSVAYAAKGTCETDTVTRCCETKWTGWRWACVQ